MAGPGKKQPRALSPTRRTLPIALLRAREMVMEKFRPMLSAHGITEQQWRVMRVLQECTTADATQLAHGAAILGPSLTRILKALEARRFVVSRRDPQDRRRWIIELTEDGEAFIAALAPESREINSRIVSKIGQQRMDDLLNELEWLQDTLEND